VYVPTAVCPVANGLPLNANAPRLSYHWILLPAAVRSGIVLPKQALLFEAVGAIGIVFTTTEVVPSGPVHPNIVADTEYVPEFAVVTLARVGFCDEEIKPAGPFQEYVVPSELAVKLSVTPVHTGLLLDAIGAEGVWFIVATVVPAELGGHAPSVAITEYVPFAAVVTPAMEGFCEEEVKLFGPVQEYVTPEMVLAVKLRI